MIRSIISGLGALALLAGTACTDASSFMSPAAPATPAAPALLNVARDAAASRFDSPLMSSMGALCLTVSEATPATLASLAPCVAGSPTQRLNFPAVGTAGAVQMFGGTACLDNYGAKGRAGDWVGIYTCYPGAAPQTWTLTAEGELRGINDLCVDASGAVSNGPLTLQRCNGSTGQRWAGSLPQAPAAGGARLTTKIVHSATGLCLATSRGSSALVTPSVLGPCSSDASQLVEMPPVGTPGSVTLFSGSVCLDNFGAKGRAGDAVGVYTCYAGAAPQTWTLTSTGEFKGINGLCVAGGGGAEVTLQHCDGSTAQRWTASSTVPSSPGTSPLRMSGGLVNALAGRCLATEGGRQAIVTPNALAPCDGSASQLLDLPAVGTSGPVFQFSGSVCLDNFGAKGRAGDVVGVYTCYVGAPTQTWMLTSTGEFKGVNGLCVTAGAQLTLERCDGSTAQRWSYFAAGSTAPVVTPPVVTTPPVTTNPPVVAVAVTLNSPSLTVGQSTQAVVGPASANANANAGNGAATWSSSAPSVASVSAAGLVTALGPGAANIVATVDGRTGSALVTVTAAVSLPATPGSSVAREPELPRVYLDTRYQTPTGRTIMVSAGDNLQTVLDTARAGDLILLQAGATFAGSFQLKPKSGTERITIRTNTTLPPEGTRMTPMWAGSLAKLMSMNANPALWTEGNASHYRIVGVELTTSPAIPYSWNLVMLGSSSARTVAEISTDIVLDRVYVHGHTTQDLARCIALNSVASAVIDSYVSSCRSRGRDSQAIGSWSGPGPYKIVNNYLEGSGENIMFGGAEVLVPGQIPSDIEIRGNHVAKPLSWLTEGVWVVKNSLELKAGQRVLIDGNVFENNWAGGQTGVAIVMYSTNEGNSPWSGVMDVTFSNNIVRNSPGGVIIGAGMSNAQPAQRIAFVNNLFERIGDTRLRLSLGRMIQVVNDVRDLTFAHNTFVFAPDPVARHSSLLFDGAKPSRVAYVNNVTEGLVAAQGLSRQDGLDNAVNGWTMAGNVLAGIAPYFASLHPDGNYFPETLDQAGVTNWFTGNVRLRPGSMYQGRATNGRDPGVDYTTLVARTGNVVDP